MDTPTQPSRPSFDRRPLALVIFERNWRWIVYIALALLLLHSTGEPWAEGLEPRAQRALAIFIVCVVLWVFNLLPLMITSILAMVLPPLMGVMSSSETFSLFGNKAVFFLLGAFILAAAVSECGLAERITLAALRLCAGSVRRLTIGIYATGAGLSMIMSEHAVAALLFPIVLELCRSLDLEPRKSMLGRLFFLTMAWGCIIGGVATLLGGARNPLAIGILEEGTGQNIGFFEWTWGIWPAVLTILVTGYVVLAIAFPIEKNTAAPAEDFLRKRSRKLGLVSGRERLIGLIMAFTIAAWVFYGRQYGLAEISLLSVVALFSFKLITWRQIEENVNWGVLLMYGGAIALGSTLTKSGATLWIASRVLSHGEISEFGLLALLSTMSVFLTEAVSNSAVVSILMPLGLALAENLGYGAKAITYAIAMPSGLAFTLPMATPALALAYSSGYLRVKHAAFVAVVFNFIAIAIFLLTIKLYWPLIGLTE